VRARGLLRATKQSAFFVAKTFLFFSFSHLPRPSSHDSPPLPRMPRPKMYMYAQTRERICTNVHVYKYIHYIIVYMLYNIYIYIHVQCTYTYIRIHARRKLAAERASLAKNKSIETLNPPRAPCEFIKVKVRYLYV